MISKRSRVFNIALMLLSSTVAGADQSQDEQALARYQQQLERLDKVNFHPNLLPLILKNKDYLELTPQQVASFQTWRKTNARAMFATMNDIIRKRIEFREAALSPDTSAEDLRRMQQEIFKLHQKVLDYKLACRENILKTFTKQNWEDFYVVLAEEGYAIPTENNNTEIAGMSVAAE